MISSNRIRLQDCGDVLSPRDVQSVLGLGRDGTYALLRAGTIRSVRIGHKWLVPRLAVEQFIALGCAVKRSEEC